MKLRLSEWASMADVLSAIAIVVSLVFVGLQISDGNREARAATVQSALKSEMAFQLYNMLMTQNQNQFEQMSSGYLEFDPDAISIPVT